MSERRLYEVVILMRALVVADGEDTAVAVAQDCLDEMDGERHLATFTAIEVKHLAPRDYKILPWGDDTETPAGEWLAATLSGGEPSKGAE